MWIGALWLAFIIHIKIVIEKRERLLILHCLQNFIVITVNASTMLLIRLTHQFFGWSNSISHKHNISKAEENNPKKINYSTVSIIYSIHFIISFKIIYNLLITSLRLYYTVGHKGLLGSISGSLHKLGTINRCQMDKLVKSPAQTLLSEARFELQCILNFNHHRRSKIIGVWIQVYG